MMKPPFLTAQSLLLESLFFSSIRLFFDVLMAQPPPEFRITKHTEYRIISATGVFGGLSPSGGQVIFYTDRLEPKSDTVGNLSLGSVNRELQVEVHLSHATFKSIADWMTLKVKEFEDQQKQQIASVKMEQPPEKVYT
jgi:hypothetical protein